MLASSSADADTIDVLGAIQVRDGECVLPFDANEVIENLLKERYARGGRVESATKEILRSAYYALRPYLPFKSRAFLKRISLNRKKRRRFPEWPVDRTVDKILDTLLFVLMKSGGIDRLPFIWFWPDCSSGCVVMTHDVEAAVGLNFCSQVMDLNDSFGIKSSFQLIPEGRYAVPESLLAEIRRRGFEINVHDWNHDGNLFSSREQFMRRAQKINQAADRFGAIGFRAGALYRNPDWYDAFTISYDMSVPNVAHLDPQWGGCCTVMPYFIGRMLEIPVTTTQDYMLFYMLGEYSIDHWKNQMRSIFESNGMASFIVHPDYIVETRARDVYIKLLEHLSRIRNDQNVWLARPGEVNSWWRSRSQMQLVQRGSDWAVEGPDCERARVAYAVLDGQRITYQIESNVL